MNNWIKIVLSFFLFLLLFVAFFHPTNELSLDLGQHLLRGKIIFDTHKIVTNNLFSYTYPNFSYISYEWLTEVIFYLIITAIGINGLIIFTVFFVLSAYSFIYIYSLRRHNILLIAYISILYFRILFERTYVRPEIVSYLFLSIFIVLLYKFREKYSKHIFLLIPLQLLWVNMHIYFIVGIFIVALFLFEGMILFRKKYSGRYIRTLTSVFLLVIIASIVNPYGIKGLLFPLFLSTSYGLTVQENVSIFVAESLQKGRIIYPILFFKIVSIVLIFSLFLTFKKSRLIDWLLSLSFIIIAAFAIRNFPLFIFATFIPFIHAFMSLLNRGNNFFKKFTEKQIQIFTAIFIGIFFVIIALLSLVILRK